MEPNPGTFARFCATKCYSYRVYMYVRPVRIAFFARFCATKCYYYRPYMYVHPGVIAFLHGFARVAHANLIGSPNPLVSRAKELSRLREFPPSLRNALKPFFLVFSLDQGNSASVIKVFFAPKGACFKLPRKRGLKSASKNHFQRLVEGPGPRRRQEVVQLPHSRRPAFRQPARRVAAALRRRQRQLQQGLPALVLRTVMESTAPSCCTSPY